MTGKPHFLKDLEVREMQSLDHVKLATSIFHGIQLSSPPFCIALFGPWGSGKSTIMKLVFDEIDRSSQDDRQVYHRTFWFNAWEYESSANLFHSLLTLLVQEVPDGTRFSRRGSAVVQRVLKASRIHGQRWSACLREPDQHSPERPGEAPEAEDVQSVESIRADIDRLTEMLLVVGGKGRRKRMVVFIDDLDKCLPLHGLALLESIKLFFGAEAPIIFVFALDNSVLAQVVQAKYGYAERDFAESYIDKIFEFSFQVPSVNSALVGDLVDEIYRRSGMADRPQARERVEVEKEVVKTVLGRAGLQLSPRRIKRIINRFIWFLCHDPPLEPEAQTDPDSLEYWLTWLVATEYWPGLREYTLLYGETAFKELGNRITGHPLFPHSNDSAKQEFTHLVELRQVLEYFRKFITVPEEPHLAESQEEMRRRVMRLHEIDGALRSYGI